MVTIFHRRWNENINVKILLTGSSGLVGRNILEHTQSAHYEILTPSRQDLDLLDRENIQNYLAQHRPTMIIHAAGIVGGIEANLAQPVRFLVTTCTWV